MQEYNSAGREGKPNFMVLIDENVTTQHCYPEYCRVAELMTTLGGVECNVVSPEELEIDNNNLVYKGKKVDLIYSRFDPEIIKL